MTQETTPERTFKLIEGVFKTRDLMRASIDTGMTPELQGLLAATVGAMRELQASLKIFAELPTVVLSERLQDEEPSFFDCLTLIDIITHDSGFALIWFLAAAKSMSRTLTGVNKVIDIQIGVHEQYVNHQLTHPRIYNASNAIPPFNNKPEMMHVALHRSIEHLAAPSKERDLLAYTVHENRDRLATLLIDLGKLWRAAKA